MIRSILVLTALVLLTASAPRPGFPLEYFVPSIPNPDLQSAIDDASVSVDAENTIWITSSPLFTNGTADINALFFPDRHLTIRPDPALGRASIASTNGHALIFNIHGAGYVTLQDLDIVRSATNATDLIHILYDAATNPNHITIERCRIGSVWNSIGVAGTSCLWIAEPAEVVVRNCIFFAYLPGTFDRCVHAVNLDASVVSLYLYNNVVADYLVNGIFIDDGALGVEDALALLRNNVAVNHPDAPPGFEPHAFRTDVDQATVLTSHNVAFADDDAHAEEAGVVGARSISGLDDLAGSAFLRFNRSDVDDAFLSRTWIVIPPWDPNPDFYHLVFPDGKLHDDPSKYGADVTDDTPDFRDIAVRDDIDRQVRPGGKPAHTDRGADQADPGVALAVERPPVPAGGLWVKPERNPGPSVRARYRTERAGSLRFEVFDLGGRRLYRAARPAEAGESGVFEWAGAPTGVLSYRLSLIADRDRPAEARGRIVVLK